MTKNECLEKLLYAKESYLQKIKAWQKVQRQYKKDGSPFAIMSKNFNNAYFNLYTASDSNHPYISVYYEGYKMDELKCFEYWDDMTEQEKENKKPLILGPYSRNVYIFTCDEIEQAIKKYIKELEKRVKYYEEQIKNFDFIFVFVDEKIKEIKKFYEENKNILTYKHIKYNYNNTLFYESLHYLEENIKPHVFNLK